MKKLYLIRYGEIGTKGKNRHVFEDKLVSNVRQALEAIDKEAKINVYKTSGRIFAETNLAEDKVLNKLQKVCGIVGISPTRRVALDIKQVKKASLAAVKEALPTDDKTVNFKVSASRANKNFALDSMELNRELGAYVLENTPDGRLNVDLYNPEIELNIEVRYKHVYIYTQDIPGVGGLPVGTTGKLGVLLSGGIDSPVASWMAMKRGVEIMPIYFHSFPFTSDRAKEKVVDLTKVLAHYQGEIDLHVVHFTEIQKEINEHCPADLTTIIMRRKMIEIAEQITKERGGKGLVTGESMGQVASQTLESMHVTNIVSTMPIFRPLIGIDKIGIEARAKEIGTYETSIQPYEDCCTVFVPKTPETRPTLKQVEAGEVDLKIDDLIKEAIKDVEVIKIKK
ncbi:thiazole biosynthesis/tRNA modification protein ThiI [Halobacteroides halobius DSM 5150]|uniref:Probable tRNA sulfurtransferase n=1 Tax=Halobacteroides halobius (strain ATCC 35273 / DSM 5150 / MD-1) TaxID=748449 RepID=L0K8H6_HALHC|nr:tRNA uracil 4-sulfurtransferase ThiI [Halobacteroides halobius]AGB41296.1 thiazole biosynthesis/tRNA modification protein ThiI [Halobacteroides halobius DSM 5150]